MGVLGHLCVIERTRLQSLSEDPEGTGSDLVLKKPPRLSPSSRARLSADPPDATFSSLLPSALRLAQILPRSWGKKPRQRWLFCGVTAWARKELKAARRTRVGADLFEFQICLFSPEAKGGKSVPAFALTTVTILPWDNYLPQPAWLQEKMSEESAVMARLGKVPVGWF